MMENSASLAICNNTSASPSSPLTCNRRPSKLGSVCNKLLNGGRNSAAPQLISSCSMGSARLESSAMLDASYSKLKVSSANGNEQIVRLMRARRKSQRRPQEQHPCEDPLCAIDLGDSQGLRQGRGRGRRKLRAASQINSDAILILNNNNSNSNNNNHNHNHNHNYNHTHCNAKENVDYDTSSTDDDHSTGGGRNKTSKTTTPYSSRQTQNLLTDLKGRTTRVRLMRKRQSAAMLSSMASLMAANIVVAVALALCAASVLIFQSQFVVCESLQHTAPNNNNNNNNDPAASSARSGESSIKNQVSLMSDRSDVQVSSSSSSSSSSSTKPALMSDAGSGATQLGQSAATANSIVASLSSAVASAAVATAVAAAQSHLAGGGGGDARSLGASAKKGHQHSLHHQTQTGRSQGGLNLALKIADSIPEVPYNILHNMKKVEHAAPFYDAPNKLVGPSSKVKESAAGGLLTKAFATASGGAGSGSGGLGGAAEQLGYLLRSPIWKRIASGYEDFASELRTRFKLNSASPMAPMKGSTGAAAASASTTTSKLIRDVSVPALLMLLASAIPTEWRPIRTRRKSTSSGAANLAPAVVGSAANPFDSYLAPAESLARPSSFMAGPPELAGFFARTGSGPNQPLEQQQQALAAAFASGASGLRQHQAQARSSPASDANLQGQHQYQQVPQPVDAQLGGGGGGGGNWLNDRSQTQLAVQSSSGAGRYQHQHHQQQQQQQQQQLQQYAAQNSLGEHEQQVSSVRRSGETYPTQQSSVAQHSSSVSMDTSDLSGGGQRAPLELVEQTRPASSLTSPQTSLAGATDEVRGGGILSAADVLVGGGHFSDAKLISLDANLQQQPPTSDPMSAAGRRDHDKDLIGGGGGVGGAAVVRPQTIDARLDSSSSSSSRTLARRLGEIQLGNGAHGYTLIGADSDNEERQAGDERRRPLFRVPLAALARSVVAKLAGGAGTAAAVAEGPAHGGLLRADHHLLPVERRQLLSNGIGPNGLVLSEQRDLSLLLPQAWKDVVKRTVSNVQQQATSQWKSIEGQLTNWVQDKLKAFPIAAPSSAAAAAASATSSTGGTSSTGSASTPAITLASSGSGGPAPVANLIASVSSTAMNILGLGSRSQSSGAGNNSATGEAGAGSGSSATTSSAMSATASATAPTSATTSKGKQPAASSSSSVSRRAQQSVEAALSGVANMIVSTLTTSANRQQTNSPVAPPHAATSISFSSSDPSSSSPPKHAHPKPTPTPATAPAPTTNQRGHDLSMSSAHPAASVASQYPTVTVSSPATSTSGTSVALAQPSTASTSAAAATGTD